jgi:CheY-like chemotaxis protein
VLVVDDEPRIRKLVSVVLGQAGYDVRTAVDGADGLAMVRDDPPDLIISDVLMPVMDGRQLVAALQADDRLRHIPIILVTASSGRQALPDALPAGVDHLRKPFVSAELVALVRSRLARAGVRRPLPPSEK